MYEQFGSIMIYLSTFSISILLFWIGQNLYGYELKVIILRKIIFFLAVLIPSILAGVRANSVGIDVKVYIVSDMRMACSVSTHSFVDCCVALDRAPEYLYLFLVYVSSLFTTDEGFLLFL